MCGGVVVASQSRLPLCEALKRTKGRSKTHLSHPTTLCLYILIWLSANAPRRCFISWRFVARKMVCSART